MERIHWKVPGRARAQKLLPHLVRPRIPEAQTPTANPVTADAAPSNPRHHWYTRTEEVDPLWTQANAATLPATAGVNNAAITPASLYSMVQDIVTEIALPLLATTASWHQSE